VAESETLRRVGCFVTIPFRPVSNRDRKDAPMQVIHVHWEGSEYHVVRVAEEHPPELVFCDSPEDLAEVLRGLGVAQPGVTRIMAGYPF